MTKGRKWIQLPIFLAFSLSASLLSRSSSAQPQDQESQVIELTAKKYEYSPSPVHIKAGTKVQLKITATDHDHGFKIATVPDGSEPSSKPGLVFVSPQECFLETLPVDFREVLILRELEEMSYKEIAKVTGMPPGTVMSRLSRARSALRQSLTNLVNADTSQSSLGVARVNT